MSDLRGQGKTWNQIGQVLGRPATQCSRRHMALIERARQIKADMHREQTKCLRCRSTFYTQDKRKNRICEPCTEINNEISGGYGGLDFFAPDTVFGRHDVTRSHDDESLTGTSNGQE
jgi:hypothetical protein